MSITPYVVLFSLAAFALVEAVAYLAMKDDAPSSRRVQPE